MSKSKADKYYDALDALLDKPIAYNPAFKKVTGKTSAAVWLSQVWYWSKRTSNKDGWFWKSAKECEEETGLTDNEQMTARRICLELGVTEEVLKGVPATMHYRLIKSRLYELLGVQFPIEQETEPPKEAGTGSGQNGEQVPDASVNINKVSEITPEITPSNGGLSEKENQQANAKMDAIVAALQKVKYTNREKMLSISDEYVKYCDLYVELCGKDRDGNYNQVPTKRVFNDWMSTFEEWKQEHLKDEHIRAAWQHANRPDGGFPVGRPGALTNTAVAMKSKVLQPQFTPAINEGAVERTKELIQQKTGGEFSPRPANVPAPAIIKQKLQEAARQKGIRK